jgi:hypothetical protein
MFVNGQVRPLLQENPLKEEYQERENGRARNAIMEYGTMM